MYAVGQGVKKYGAGGSAKSPGTNSSSEPPYADRASLAKGEIDELIDKGVLDVNKVFKLRDSAAKEVLTKVQSISDKYNLELGGSIETVEGGFTYSRPTIGSDGEVKIIYTDNSVAGYHTHPGGGFNSSYFSNENSNPVGGDIEHAFANDKPLYMSNTYKGTLNIRVCEPGYATCMANYNPTKQMSYYGVSGREVK